MIGNRTETVNTKLLIQLFDFILILFVSESPAKQQIFDQNIPQILIDNFDLALTSVSLSGNEEYIKGIQMLQKQFKDILTNLGVEEFGEVGDSFDPNIHNAVAQVEDDSQTENVIVEIFRKGYSIQDRVIRHAMVKVAN